MRTTRVLFEPFPSVGCLPGWLGRGLFYSILALALAPLTACGRAPAHSARSTKLNIGTALPPTTATSGIDAVVDSLTLESPIVTDWNGRASPRSITGWEWLDHGLGLRLHLQPGLELHDGSVLTNQLAADILNYGLTLSGERMVLSPTITSVKPEGANDIVIRTTQPEGFLLSDISTVNFSPADRPSIGTGPFKLVSRGETITMQAFADYRAGEPQIASVQLRNFDTQRAAWAAMMRDEIDLLYDISGDAAEFVEAESTVRTYPVLRAYYNALVFNNRRAPFTNRDVRRALNMAVDREQIVSAALKGRGRPTDNPIWPFHWAYPTDVPAYTFDRDAARRLLDANGFVEGHVPGSAGGMPSRLSFSCLMVQGDQRLEAIARVLQKQLFSLGVDMRVEPVPLRGLRARVGGGDFDAAILEFGSLRSLSFLYGFWHSPVAGITGFPPSSYSGADHALDALRSATTDDDIRAAVRRVGQVFHDDPPAVFLAWLQINRALDRRFSPPQGDERDKPDILGSIPRWRITSELLASR